MIDLVARLRRMADMTTVGNDLNDIKRAADEIERLERELIKLQQAYENVCSANADMGDYIAAMGGGDLD